MSNVDIVAEAFGALGLPCQVDGKNIVANLDTFTTKDGVWKRRGVWVRTPDRVELSAVRTKLTVEFPIGDRMNSTIKKFLTSVREKIAELDAQDERKAELDRLIKHLHPSMRINSISKDDLVSNNCEIVVRLPITQVWRAIETLKGIL